MKSNGMTPVGIAAWFRSKAREFSDIADKLDETFSPVAEPGQMSLSGGLALAERKRLVAVLGDGRSRRIGELAKETGMPEHTIRALVEDSNDEIAINERGWVRIPEMS